MLLFGRCIKCSDMPAKKRLLFVNQELAPYMPSSPMASLAKETVLAIHGKSAEVRTFMPNFGAINERRNQLHEVIRLSGANIPINDNDHPLILKVASLPPARIQVYFIDNDDFFQKEDSDIDAIGSNRADNDERAIFYARGTAETVRKLKWEPNIIQSSGWMTALTPLYMRKLAKECPEFTDTRLVYAPDASTIQAPLDPEILRKLAEDGVIEADDPRFAGREADTDLLHRLAIEHSDALVCLAPINPELIELARERQIPVITAEELGEGKERIEKLKEFYLSL